MCSHDDALAMALQEFRQNDPYLMAENSACAYDEGKNRFRVNYCGQTYYLYYPGGEVETEGGDSFAGEEKVLFLQYLNKAQSLPPRRKWLSFLELPNGEMHHAPFLKEAVYPLAEKYGKHVEEFIKASQEVGEPMDAGDAAFIIPVFPRLEMATILWGEDEEYSARANVLFDEVSTYHLATASLYVLGIMVVKRIYGI